MNRQKPSPALDWRALAADRPQRRLPLEPITTPLTIRYTCDRHNQPLATVTGIGDGADAYALDLRHWAQQLTDAADRLESGS